MTKAAVAVGLSLALVACGAGHRAAAPARAATPVIAATPGAPDSTACQVAAARELDDVARRIYAQAVDGRNLVASVRRVRRSQPLAAALERDDPAAVRAALPKIVRHQVVRLVISDAAGRPLVTYGRPVAAYAPVRGTLRDARGATIGHYLLTVADDRQYIGVVRNLTGAQVMIHAGAARVTGSLRPGPRAASLRAAAVTYRGVRYRVATIAARAYPSGPLTISLLVPPTSPSVCGATAAATRLRTIGFVGQHLFQQEQSSTSVRVTLRYVADTPAFRSAVAASDPAAIRAAIVGFFGNHRYHIVRVRVTRGAKVLQDVGGPYALAPVSATVMGPDGAPAGTFTLAVQDDTGYIKLMHRFTGAVVQLRMRGVTVPGSTLAPGPATLPAFGPVAYAGQTYDAFSFTAVAFPSGPLDIGLLVPPSAGG